MFRICTILALLVVGATHAAQAQTAHSHPASDAQLHYDFYSKWNMPNSQQSCCNRQDCYPTRAYFDLAGRVWMVWIRETNTHEPVPKHAYDPDNPPTTSTPDGHAHVCAVLDTTGQGLTATIRCFVPPDTKS